MVAKTSKAGKLINRILPRIGLEMIVRLARGPTRCQLVAPNSIGTCGNDITRAGTSESVHLANVEL